MMARVIILVTCPPCPHCGERAVVEVFRDEFLAWQAGTFIQHAMPEMHADQRELLITGFHPECWNEVFSE